MDGHPRQNPAYRPATEKPPQGGFSSSGPVRSPGDAHPLPHVVALLDEVGDRDREVLGADLAGAVLVDEQLVAAELVAALALARVDVGGWADERPVDVVGRAVHVQRLGSLQCLRLPLLMEVGRVEQTYTRRDLEAPGPADHDEAPRTRSAETVDQRARD